MRMVLDVPSEAHGPGRRKVWRRRPPSSRRAGTDRRQHRTKRGSVSGRRPVARRRGRAADSFSAAITACPSSLVVMKAITRGIGRSCVRGNHRDGTHERDTRRTARWRRRRNGTALVPVAEGERLDAGGRVTQRRAKAMPSDPAPAARSPALPRPGSGDSWIPLGIVVQHRAAQAANRCSTIGGPWTWIGRSAHVPCSPSAP